MEDALYREQILEHYRNPHNFGSLAHCSFSAKVLNRSCGDAIEVFVLLNKKSKVKEAKFLGRGCALSTAAASMLTEHIRDMTLHELQKVSKEEVLRLLGVAPDATRMRCATLALQALQAGLDRAISKKYDEFQ